MYSLKLGKSSNLRCSGNRRYSIVVHPVIVPVGVEDFVDLLRLKKKPPESQRALTYLFDIRLP